MTRDEPTGDTDGRDLPATCTDDWCATCGYLNEDARHVYGCDCACNLLARDHPDA